LEIRRPGQLREVINQVLAAIILALAEELDFEFNNLGSMRMNRPDRAMNEHALAEETCDLLLQRG
jgi:hypothetical protein